MASPAPPLPHETPELRDEPRARGPARRPVLVLGLVALLAALAFPFAPVQQSTTAFSWPAATVPPLMPYRPLALSASVTCASARDLAAGRPGGTGVLLATTPADADPTAEPLHGLRIIVTGRSMQVVTAGETVASLALPAGDCTVQVRSVPSATTVLLDGATVATREGDVRPDVAGVFTDAPAPLGLGLDVTADTRFATSISPAKAAVAAVGVAALMVMIALVVRADRTRRVRLLPPGWWRPSRRSLGPDLAVTAALALWWVVGPVTVDDGYIVGIVRSRAENGFIGNVYRWFNAPEAPFSWFYDLYWGWSTVSTSTAWMRLPSVLLGMLCWFLLSRLVLPRLLPRMRRVLWLGALTFLAWWLPFQLGLRPEPWVAVGLLGAFLGVERGVATRRLGPLVVAALLAGATTAVTPGGMMAFVPFAVAAVPVLRVLRAHGPTAVVALLAAAASASFLMVYDQGPAGLLEAVRVRAEIGGGQPWFEEYTRYALLLDPQDLQGSLAKRAAVLLTILAAVAALWTVSRRGSGLPMGPVRRAAATFLLGLGVMTATPTKWTQHFGDVAGLGAAVLAVGVVAGTAAVLRRRASSPVPWLLGLAAVVALGSLVLAARNVWPFVSNWWGLTWNDVAPPILGVPLATVWLGAGTVLLAVLLARAAWRRSSRPSWSGGAPPPRWASPAVPGVLLVLFAVALPLASFTRTSVTHRGDYTLASDFAATLAGRSCGLQERLSVETDPAAGLLAETSPGGLPVLPVDVGGFTLPGIAAGSGRTGWFALDPDQRARRLPVVVTVSGTLRPGDVLAAEFADVAGDVVARRDLPAAGETPTDRRIMAPAGAQSVRLVADGPGTVHASLPRVPRLTPMTRLLPAGTQAILDWPVAFVFPCLQPAPLPDGTAPVPQWRVGPAQSDSAAGITYSPTFGGPFAGPRLVVRERRMPTYLDTDPTRDAAQVYQWMPLVGPVA